MGKKLKEETGVAGLGLGVVLGLAELPDRGRNFRRAKKLHKKFNWTQEKSTFHKPLK